MSRSSWKGPFLQKFYLNNIGARKLKRKWLPHARFYKHKLRKSIILPQFYKDFFLIYNGVKYIKIQIEEKHFGFRFGDFVFTRKQCIYGKNKIKKKQGK